MVKMKTVERNWREWIDQIDFFVKLMSNGPNSEILSKEMKKHLTVIFERNKWAHPISTGFSTQLYRELYRIIGKRDPYKNLKELSNREAKKIVRGLSPKTFKDILLVSILGNIIDYGSCIGGGYNIKNLCKDFENLKNEKLAIDDSELLKKRIEVSKNVFYLVDNSGEIIFDTFMLDYLSSYLNKKNIYIVGKGKPMQNDITAKELEQLGFSRYGNIVSTGSDCFGLHEEEVSKNFRRIFKKAGLIIAKGQAYMEFFGEYNFKNLFNVLKVKWPIRFGRFYLKNGQNIVMCSERYAELGKIYDYGYN